MSFCFTMEKRLQSIKFPRDLTLGGTKPKKTYTPNLNVTRNKDKAKEFIIKTEDKRKHNNKKEYKYNKKFETTERFIQSSGIFSEGIGFIKKARSDRSYAAKDDSPNIMPIPKVKKNEWQVDNKNETKVFDEIMNCNDASDEDEKLSFAPVSWKETDFKETKVPIGKLEVKIEQSDNIRVDLNRLKIETSVVHHDFQETENCSDYNPALTLWNLPESFAGKGLCDDPSVKTLFDYKLNEMLEGQIGKMVIKRSGRIEVFIGSVKYHIEPAHLETFSERIIQIKVNHSNNSEECTGVTLGQPENKFILNPDWKHLMGSS